MKFQIAQIAFRGNTQLRLVEQVRHTSHLLVSNRMLHNHDGIVHITSLHQVVRQKELNLMEEHESAARADFRCIILGQVPCGRLHAEHSGIEIHRNIVGRSGSRFDFHP